MTLASPTVEDLSRGELLANFFGTVGLRAIVVASPFIALLMQRTPLARVPAAIFIGLIALNVGHDDVLQSEKRGPPLRPLFEELRRLHQVDEPVPFEVAFAAERHGGIEEDALHIERLPDELAPNGEEGRDGAGHVRRRHAGAAVFDV